MPAQVLVDARVQVELAEVTIRRRVDVTSTTDEDDQLVRGDVTLR